MNWYQPATYAAGEKLCRALVADSPLALWLSLDGESESISFLPTIIDPENPLALLAHLAWSNPHAKALQDPSLRTQLIFQGPDAYVSSRWYVSGRDVPTWYYSAVRIKGSAKLVSGEKLLRILKLQTLAFEKTSPVPGEAPWEFSLPADLADSKTLDKAIVGIEFTATSWEGKSKLGQNRGIADREAALAGLSKVQKISNQDRLLQQLKSLLSKEKS